MQSGLYYGYLALVDGILERLLAELGTAKVVATGGLAPLMGADSKFITNVDDLLTLEGMRIIWERNAAPARRRSSTESQEQESRPAAHSARRRS